MSRLLLQRALGIRSVALQQPLKAFTACLYEQAAQAGGLPACVGLKQGHPHHPHHHEGCNKQALGKVCLAQRCLPRPRRPAKTEPIPFDPLVNKLQRSTERSAADRSTGIDGAGARRRQPVMGAGFATCVGLLSPALRMDPVGFRMRHQPSSDRPQRLQTPSDPEIGRGLVLFH